MLIIFGEMKCRVFFAMAFEVERDLKDGSSKSLAALLQEIKAFSWPTTLTNQSGCCHKNSENQSAKTS